MRYIRLMIISVVAALALAGCGAHGNHAQAVANAPAIADGTYSAAAPRSRVATVSFTAVPATTPQTYQVSVLLPNTATPFTATLGFLTLTRSDDGKHQLFLSYRTDDEAVFLHVDGTMYAIGRTG